MGVLKIKPLTPGLVDPFDMDLRADPLTNVFYLLDLHDPRERERSKFYLALRGNKIEGKLLVYSGLLVPSVWIRGSKEAVLRLMETVDVPDQAILSADRELGDLIRSKVSATAQYPTEVMALKRGEHRVFVRHDVEELTEKHAMNYLKLFREYQPSLGTIKEKEIQNFRVNLRTRNAYGIFVDGSLASTTVLLRYAAVQDIRWIGFTFTKERYRGRGFATSLVSKAVSDGFQDARVSQIGLIVRSTNEPARRVYQKVGFKKHMELTWLNLKTEMAP